MIGKMKKKTKKVHVEDMKVEESADVEMAEVPLPRIKKATKPKKRAMDSGNKELVPTKKKAKIETSDDIKKPQKKIQVEKKEVKSHKEEAEEAKKKKRMRKMKEKKFYEVREEVKKLWEDLRKIDLESKRRAQVTNEMYTLVEGKVVHFVFAHDTSRCVQSLVKFGTNAQKETIFKELKGSLVKMMKSTFAKFCIRKFIKYGSKKQREDIFQLFKGNVANLLRHKEASDIVELAYNDYANVKLRNSMEEEFYGPTYLINKTPKTKNLTTFKEEFPDKMANIIHYMKDKLFSLAEKNILQLSFVHKLLYDFFEVADSASRAEIIETLKEHTAHLVHTRNGCRVAMRCLWFGTTKDRKSIVKSLKTLVMKVAQEEHGHLFLLAILDSLDDTRLVSKAVLDEFVKSMEEVIENQFSRKVLLYLLSPRNPMFFHPDVIKILVQGDANPHSKKDPEIRRNELLTYISAPLIKWVTPNVRKLTTDNNLLLVLLAIVNNVTGDSGELMRQVAAMVAEPFPAKGFHFIDDSSGHLVLKKMIGRPSVAVEKEAGPKDGGGDDGNGDNEGVKDDEGGGDDNDANNDKEGGDDNDEEGGGDNDKGKVDGNKTTFAEVLMETVSADDVKSWTHCNRGCFILVLLLELRNDHVTCRINEALLNFKSAIKKQDTKGAQILLKKLS